MVANSIDNTFDYTLEKGYAAYDIKATGSSDAYTIVGDDDNGSYSGFFTDLYYDSDLTSKSWNDGAVSGYTVSNVSGETTSFLTSSATLVSNGGVLPDAQWGQNDNVNGGYPFLKGWMDFYHSTSQISDQISSDDTVGTFTFIDGGVSTTVQSYSISPTLKDNQYFTIDGSSLEINSSGVTQISGELPRYSYSRTYYHRVTSRHKRVFKLNVVDITAPTVTLTDTDSDNLVSASNTVTITASFNEAMTATPTISISVVTNVVMTFLAQTLTLTFGILLLEHLQMELNTATVSGSDISGNAYVAGTQSITFTVDKTAPTVSLSKSTTNATLPYTGTVTITATFSESMANSPTISVGGVSNAVMTSTSSSVWEYNWTINNGSWMTANTTTTTFATVSGTDIVGNAYSGTTSISFTIDNSPPTITSVTADSNGTFTVGDTVSLTLNLSEIAYSSGTVSLALTLETGAVDRVVYADPASYDTNAIKFYYTVQSGDTSSDLSYVSSSSLVLNSEHFKIVLEITLHFRFQSQEVLEHLILTKLL